jgi:hypothetical protein
MPPLPLCPEAEAAPTPTSGWLHRQRVHRRCPPEPENRDIEATAAYVMEQATPYDPADEPGEPEPGLVSEWDAAGQAEVVDFSDEC